MTEPAPGPNLGLVSGYTTGAPNWGTGMNLNLRTLDALGFFTVRVAPLAAPPSSPSQGDRYIIAPGATGAWSGHDNALTVWTTDETNTALWDFFTPQDGWSAKLVPSSSSSPIQVYTFRGGAWSITTSDIPVFSASGTGHMQGLVPDPGSAAGTTHFLREDATWAAPSTGPTYSPFSASGTAHSAGLVPDPGSSAGTVHFLREDATWATLPPGTTYSVFSASGTAHSAGLVPDPGSSAGTVHFLREDATWATLPAGTTYSVFSASGTAHSAGLVPDPGSSAGTSHFLREDSSWATIPAASGWELSDGTTTVVGVSEVVVSGAVVINAGGGVADLVINPTLSVTQGTTTQTGVSSLTVLPNAGTISSGSSGSVTLTAAPVHLYASTTGTFTASQPLLRIPVLSAYVFPSGLSGSVFKFGTAATAAASLLISNNGSTVGTITVPASSTTGTVSMSSSQTVTTGNVFLISAPATPDSTLADADFGIIASR